VEENHKPFYQEEGIVVIQAIIDDVFEEAIGFRVSSEYGGGHGTAKEERHKKLNTAEERHKKLNTLVA
jgi:hypothetical protein